MNPLNSSDIVHHTKGTSLGRANSFLLFIYYPTWNHNRYSTQCLIGSLYQSLARSHQETRRNCEQLGGTDSEMFRTWRLHEKLTNSSCLESPTRSHQKTVRRLLATERNGTVLLRRASRCERLYDATQQNSSVPFRRVSWWERAFSDQQDGNASSCRTS